MNTLENEKSYALKLALNFLRFYCRDWSLNEMNERPSQWRDYRLTANTIVGALNREARQQKLAEDKVAKRKAKNKEVTND